MLSYFTRLFRQHRHVMIVLKPGEAAVMAGLFVQIRQNWERKKYRDSAYLERAMIQFDNQLKQQMTEEMAEDATEDIAIAQAMGEYPEYPDPKNQE